MSEMLQKSENVAKNVANENSQDLTEQFSNNEIDESKLYYFKQKMSEEIEIGHPFSLNMVRAMDDTYLDWFLIEEVLAPVPSYEEYQKLLSDQLAKIEGEEINAELEAENAKLKKILKECFPYVNHRFMGTRETLTKLYMASDKVLHKKAEKLLTKIGEVLK